MKTWVLLLGCLVILLAACQENYQVCPDGVTQVLDLESCPSERPTCPASCDDGNACTQDVCNAATNYTCAHRESVPCDGNGICEQGEFSWSADCPASCDDGNACTTDSYNYGRDQCTHQEILPCCGNAKCDLGETYVTCGQDCEQKLDIEVLKYERRQRLEGAQNDLSGTQYTYLIVTFTLNNLGFDDPETLNFRTERGFYYDPYKMRLEDEKGNLYNVEYDSDLVAGWLDYSIIPMRNTVTATVTFIVPFSTGHLRLIAYDRFGARLDSSEVM